MNYRKVILLILFLLPTLLTAGPRAARPGPSDAEDADETSITFTVKDLGSIEMPALVAGQALYCSAMDLFSFLQVRSVSSVKGDSITGSFPLPSDKFLIDQKLNRITYRGKTTNLSKNDLFKTASTCYLKADLFKMFGLIVKFNFRNLSAELISNTELPALKEMRLEQMRQNLRRLKGNRKADTLIKLERSALRFGVVEWGVATSNSAAGLHDNRLTLGLGSVVAGGETNLGLYYRNTEKFSEKQQFYQWKYVNNNDPFIKQVLLGKIPINSISSVYNPVVGGQVSNSPTIYRKSYGTYPTSGFTDPNWTVELFVNGELVDYKKADVNGFYEFDIPLVYGNSNIQLRFYGPYGEERSRELTISIPFNFLPYHETQYQLSAGIVEDSLHSRFAKASIGYGLNRIATVGAGIEYLSSVTSGKTMPFVSTSVRLSPKLIFTSDYVYSVRQRAILDYRLPGDLLIELNYTHYALGQTAINYNYREERKVLISMPYRAPHFALYSRLTVDQIVLPLTRYVMADYLISASTGRTTINVSTFANVYKENSTYYYSNFSFSYRFKDGWVVTPSAQYEYSKNDFLSARINVEKNLFRHGFLTFSAERLFAPGISSVFAGLRYELPSAQTTTAIRSTAGATFLDEAASGSFIFDKKQRMVKAYNRPVIGRAALSISCFLDLNGNGKRDKGEPRLDGLKLRLGAGTVKYSKQDTSYHIFDLEPYVTYYAEVEAGFQNLSWKLKYASLNIAADPNQVKSVEIPVIALGEVSGTVMYVTSGVSKGFGRIFVNFYNDQNTVAGRAMTESDGSFVYLGLRPGKYTVHMDDAQLERLGFTSTPSFKVIQVTRKAEGDVVENVGFTIQERVKVLSKVEPILKAETIRSAESKSTIGTETSDSLVSDVVSRYSAEQFSRIVVQTVFFGDRTAAYKARAMLIIKLQKPVDVFLQGKYHRFRVEHIRDMNEAYELRNRLEKLGYYSVIFHSAHKKTQP